MSIKTGQFIKLYKIVLNYVKSFKIICFFFLYSQQRWVFFSNIYGGVFLLKVINYFLTAKSHQLFLQKSTNIDFSFCCEYESWQYCQKNIHLKDISPVMLKLYYYPADFILSHESEKRVTERSRLDFWRLFFNCGTQSLIPPDWAIENDLCQILCMILQFFVKERGLRLSFFFFFFLAFLPQTL